MANGSFESSVAKEASAPAAGLLSSHAWDEVRQKHMSDGISWDHPVNKVLAYAAEPMVFGGVPGIGTAVLAGGGVLAVEHTVSHFNPSFEPGIFTDAAGKLPTFLESFNNALGIGFKLGTLDFATSMVADKVFGADSTVAKVLAPNILGLAAETAGACIFRTPQARIVGGVAGYAIGKAYNYLNLEHK